MRWATNATPRWIGAAFCKRRAKTFPEKFFEKIDMSGVFSNSSIASPAGFFAVRTDASIAPASGQVPPPCPLTNSSLPKALIRKRARISKFEILALFYKLLRQSLLQIGANGFDKINRVDGGGLGSFYHKANQILGHNALVEGIDACAL